MICCVIGGVLWGLLYNGQMTKIQPNNAIDRRLSVAPMMDWTNRHCRFFHRLLAPDALLFTEMVTAEAVLHGDAERLLGHDPAEYPLALQLGGSNQDRLAQAMRGSQPPMAFRKSISMSAARQTACNLAVSVPALWLSPIWSPIVSSP